MELSCEMLTHVIPYVWCYRFRVKRRKHIEVSIVCLKILKLDFYAIQFDSRIIHFLFLLFLLRWCLAMCSAHGRSWTSHRSILLIWRMVYSMESLRSQPSQAASCCVSPWAAWPFHALHHPVSLQQWGMFNLATGLAEEGSLATQYLVGGTEHW